MPTETAVSVTDNTVAEAVELNYGETFTVVAEVAKGDGSHELVRTAKTFKLPASDNQDTTYVISATEAGKIHVAPSTGEAYDVTIVGWDNLATKADISAVFKYKGTVATKAELPNEGNEAGFVYFVTADASEYVWANDAWEELGPIVDLSAYAQSKDVIQRVTGAEGMVPKLTAAGTLESTGFTIAASVPADAKFITAYAFSPNT